MLQSIHDCKQFCWATRWVPSELVIGGDQPFVRRLIGVSTSPMVGSIYNMGVWDKAAAKWLRVDVRRTLAAEAEARRQNQLTGRSLENGGCIGEPHLQVERCLVFLCILHCCMAMGRLQVAFIEARLEDLPKENTEAVPACTPLQVKDVVVRADNVRHIRILWSDRDGENSVGLGGVHKILARDPALGLALLRGLQGWEQGRVVSTTWGPARPYRPSTWAHMAEVGWVGCEEGDRWREMGGGEGEERGNAATTTPNPQAANPPPPSQPNPPPPHPRPTPTQNPNTTSRGSASSRTMSPTRSLPRTPQAEPSPPRKKKNNPPLPPKTKATPAPIPKGEEKGEGEAKGGGIRRRTEVPTIHSLGPPSTSPTPPG